MGKEQNTSFQSNTTSKRKVVLVTGASRGLGLAIVRRLIAMDKYHVIATARASSIPRFKAAGIQNSDHVWVRPLDILQQLDRRALVNETNYKLGGVDVLINNAAYMLRAVVEHVGEIERFKQIDTNFRGPMALIKAFLPGMREKRDGQIINISSVGGMMAMPTMSIYNASKYALEGATEALWYEVRPWNIRVSIVQPGFIRSDSFENVKTTRECSKAMTDPEDPYYHHYNSMIPFIEKLMRMSPATPEKIAMKIVRLIERRRPPLRVAGTLDAYLFYYIRRMLPRQLYHTLLYIMLPKIMRWGKGRSSSK